jgi:putative tryptophan/tyrosine transport system substrate-binding protein
MNFRQVVATLLFIGIGGTSLGVFGQNSSKMHRIAFINVGPAAPNKPYLEAFQSGLRDAGYVEGKNIIVDYRWADGRVDRLPGLVQEILALKPDVVVSTGGPPTILALKAATQSVPVVFITGDPINEGIVSSLARPGGNLTGFSVLAEELEGKRLELLKLVLPKTTRIGIIWNPAQPTSANSIRAMESAAGRLGLSIQSWPARDAVSLDQALAAAATAKVDALVLLADAVLGFERARIVEFASRSQLPGIYFWREFVEIGGLMSYGTNLSAMYRRTASYVDKILKGTKPGDLPIEQPTTFEFVINSGTAKALGIAIPPSVLMRADEVIQ